MVMPVYNSMSILIMYAMLINYQIGYRFLRVETKRSWGSLNTNGGYWNILRISLNQVDSGYNITTSNVSVLTIKNRCDA